MSKNVKGYILGYLASLLGVFLWIIFYYVGIIGSAAALVMGVFYILTYRKVTNTMSKKVIYIGFAIVVINTILGILGTVILTCITNKIGLGELLSIKENQTYLYTNLGIGLFLGLSCYGLYAYAEFKKLKGIKDANKRYAPINKANVIDSDFTEIHTEDTTTVNVDDKEKDENNA